ncbi:hypothetical protein BHE74_00037750, partial [Ensete ventricosum]
PPYQEAAAPTTGSAPGHGRALPLLAAALTGDTSTRRRRLYELLPLRAPLASVAPCGLALAAAGCPSQPTWSWVAGSTWGLAVAGHHSSSS